MKEYWIVNGLYACPTKERAEQMLIGKELLSGQPVPDKTIEHVFVLSDDEITLLEKHRQFIEWLKNPPYPPYTPPYPESIKEPMDGEYFPCPKCGIRHLPPNCPEWAKPL